ncbi:MAG: PIN domain-containing protein [Deltaproteobacteria bacterium]|nr:PIN domain-containing protein [Deltaproteobacteria bacterium]
MKDKCFLDTNVFIYAIDTSPDLKEKREISRHLIKEYIKNETGVISIQVLQEFYQVSTHKIQVPLSNEEALEYLHYMSVLDTVHPEFDMIVAGIRLHEKHRISFWDALIIQAALTTGCTRLLSEDLQHGFEVDDLTVENPFL